VAKKAGVECLVAPYEADAQLAYLARQGYVNAVITEDSDLLAFGCPTVLYKMDDFGSAKMMQLHSIVGHKKEKLDLTAIDEAKFTECCILAGCDYLDSIPGFGFSRAVKEVLKYKSVKSLLKVHRYGLAKGKAKKVEMPDNYEDNFERAQIAFKHHLVFCHKARGIVNLNPIVTEEEADSKPSSTSNTSQEIRSSSPPSSAAQLLKKPFIGVPESPLTPSPAPSRVINLVDDEIDDEIDEVSDMEEISGKKESDKEEKSSSSQDPSSIDYLSILGTRFSTLEAVQICLEAKLDPKTKKAFTPAPKPVPAGYGSKTSQPVAVPKGQGIMDAFAKVPPPKAKMVMPMNEVSYYNNATTARVKTQFKKPGCVKSPASMQEIKKKDEHIFGAYRESAGNTTTSTAAFAPFGDIDLSAASKMERNDMLNPFSTKVVSPGKASKLPPTGANSVLVLSQQNTSRAEGESASQSGVAPREESSMKRVMSSGGFSTQSKKSKFGFGGVKAQGLSKRASGNLLTMHNFFGSKST